LGEGTPKQIYKEKVDGYSLMMGWLVTRTVVELAILVALIWR
jgi:hypothetical protein